MTVVILAVRAAGGSRRLQDTDSALVVDAAYSIDAGSTEADPAAIDSSLGTVITDVLEDPSALTDTFTNLLLNPADSVVLQGEPAKQDVPVPVAPATWCAACAAPGWPAANPLSRCVSATASASAACPCSEPSQDCRNLEVCQCAAATPDCLTLTTEAGATGQCVVSRACRAASEHRGSTSLLLLRPPSILPRVQNLCEASKPGESW